MTTAITSQKYHSQSCNFKAGSNLNDKIQSSHFIDYGTKVQRDDIIFPKTNYVSTLLALSCCFHGKHS